MKPPVPLHPRTAREDFVDTLEYIYGPALLAVVFGLLFATSDPVQEVLLGYASDAVQALAPPQEGTPPLGLHAATVRLMLLLLLPVGLLGLCPAATWSASRMALRGNSRGNSTWSRVLPVAFALFLAGGIWCGVYKAWTSPEAEGLDPTPLLLIALSVLYSLVALAIPAAIRLLATLTLGPQRFWSPATHFGLHYVPVAAVMLTLTVVVVWLSISPQWGGVLGAISVAALFFIVMTYLLAGLTVLSRWTPGNVPLLLVLFILAAAIPSPGFAYLVAALTLALLAAYWIFVGKPSRSHLIQIAAFVVLLGGIAWATAYQTACAHRAGCNHVAGAAPGDSILPDPVAAYSAWPARDTPIIRLVAAQGGGLFAAYHTAYYLAHRADTEPGFAESVFAISGVSGGSVGGGVYWAIRASGQCAGPANPEKTCHRDAVDRILRRDYLTPSLTGLFFRDNLDSFVPYTPWIAHPVDRGRVLEEEFAAALAGWLEENRADTGDTAADDDDAEATALLDTALSASWMPDKAAPLMLFNATEVGTGARRILSPVAETARNVPGRVVLADGSDLTVGTAMVISARFPIVTPPARLPVMVWEPDPSPAAGSSGAGEVRRVLQMVDGGYFDNSGIETLLDFIDDLGLAHVGRAFLGQPVVETGGEPRQIEIILFRDEKKTEPARIKGTLGAPLAAFTKAWRARWALTSDRLLARFDQAPDQRGVPPVLVCASTILPQRFNYTVSWFLARRSFDEIRQQVHLDRAGAIPTARPWPCPPPVYMGKRVQSGN